MDAPVDMNMFRTNMMRFVPVLTILVLSLGTLVSFLVAYSKGHVSYFVPFISENGARIPEIFIFSLALYFGSLTCLVLILYQYLVIRFHLDAHQNRLRNLNNIATITGIISMIGLAGVAAVPMSTVLWLHLVFAGVHFFFILIYVNAQTFIAYHVPGGNLSINRLRLLLCVALMIILLSLVIMFPLSHFKWLKANNHPPALKTPDDMFFDLMIATSSLEWLLYGVFLVFLSTFYYEFKDYEFVFGIRSLKACETEPSNN